MVRCSNGGEVLLPRALVDFDQTGRSETAMRLFVSTNGLASGNTLAEATCHALFEIIERDSSARWFGGGPEVQASTEIDLDSVAGHCSHLLDRLRRAGVDARLWEATGPLGIPSFICYIRAQADLRGLGTFGGMGAHFSRDIALSRAICEAAQSRLTVIAGSRDDTFPSEYSKQAADVEGRLPDEADFPVRFSICANVPLPTSMDAMLSSLLDRVYKAGYRRVIRFDHTADDFGIQSCTCSSLGCRCHRTDNSSLRRTLSVRCRGR